MRRSERERRAALDQVAALERSLQATESELRASQVGRSRGPQGQGESVRASAAAGGSYCASLLLSAWGLASVNVNTTSLGLCPEARSASTLPFLPGVPRL